MMMMISIVIISNKKGVEFSNNCSPTICDSKREYKNGAGGGMSREEASDYERHLPVSVSVPEEEKVAVEIKQEIQQVTMLAVVVGYCCWLSPPFEM